MNSLAKLLVALGGCVCAAQAIDTLWVRTYNYCGEDRSYDITVDSAGNVYVAGFRQGQTTGWDFLCVKYRPNGDTAWVRSGDNGDDKFWGVDVDRQGNVYAAGFTGPGGNYDYVTVKYDSGGNQLWMNRYERSGQSNDRGAALCVDDSGYCYVTGDCYDGPEPIDGATIKYKPNGDTAWVRHGPGPDNENEDVAVDSAGNVYVTGSCYNNRRGFWTAKYKPNGDTAWVRRNYWAMNGASAYRLALDASGVAVCGSRYDANWNCDMAVVKYSPDGDSLWADTMDGGWGQYDEGSRVAAGPSGSIYVAGTASTGSATYILTVKYAPGGTREWVVRYGDTLDYRGDMPYGIVTDAQGNCYVCAHSLSTLDGNSILTVKYSPDGSEAWHVFYTPEQDGADACGIGLFGSNYVYVAGAGQYGGRYWDCVTIKYDQTLGVEETMNDERGTMNAGPTIVRGVLLLPYSLSPSLPVSLLDISGRRVLDLCPGANDVSGLAPGVYLVRQASGAGREASSIRKVIIQH
jgi:hypothetical protein